MEVQKTGVLLSIIIPVFNVEDYVGACLNSVYGGNTDLSAFEVIVVNDGSTDDSAGILECYRERYCNLVLINQENQGLSVARMNGLEKAQGDFVWFIDSDDWLKPGALGSVLRIIHENTGIDVCMLPTYRTNKSADDYSLDAPFPARGIDVLLCHNLPVYSVYRYTLRRALFENKFLYFPKGLLHEDEYFGRVLLASAESVYVGNESVYSHRIRSNSIMGTISIRSSYDYISNYALLKDFAKTLPQTVKGRFVTHSQHLLKDSYTINEPYWSSPEFRRFKRKKAPYIISEYLRNERCYKFRELACLLLLTIAPKAFRRLFPAK